MPKGYPKNTPFTPAPIVETKKRRTAAEVTAELEQVYADKEGLGAMEKNLGFRYLDKEHAKEWVALWVFEDNAGWRMAQGWRMVERDQVMLSSSINRGNTDLGEAVTVPAKMPNAGGEPGKMYLMEIPKIIHLKIQANYLATNKQTEQAIQRAAQGSDLNPLGYQPQGVTSNIEHSEVAHG